MDGNGIAKNIFIASSYDGQIILFSFDQNTNKLKVENTFSNLIYKYRYIRQISVKGNLISFISEQGIPENDVQNLLVVGRIYGNDIKIEKEIAGNYELMEIHASDLKKSE